MSSVKGARVASLTRSHMTSSGGKEGTIRLLLVGESDVDLSRGTCKSSRDGSGILNWNLSRHHQLGLFARDERHGILKLPSQLRQCLTMIIARYSRLRYFHPSLSTSMRI